MIDNKTIRKVIMLNKLLPSGSPTYENREASGAVANFTTNTVQPFVSLDCEILPIQEGTGTPSPSNPRPISGTSVLNVNVAGGTKTGSNLFDKYTVSNNVYLDVNGDLQPSTSWRVSDYIPVEVSFFYGGLTQVGVAPRSCLYDENKVFISSFKQQTGTDNQVFLTSGAKYVRFSILNIAGELDNFEVYQAQTTTTTFDLGQEIMGGTADVVGGTGEETHDLLTFDGSEAWQVIASGANKRYTLTLSDYTPNNAEISDIFQYLPTTIGNFGTFYFAQGILIIPDGDDTFATLADFKQWLSENTPSFLLQRTTPTEYTFTGQPINSYLGVNNVWTDVGSTKVTYKYKTGEGGSSTKKYLPIFYAMYGKEKYK